MKYTVIQLIITIYSMPLGLGYKNRKYTNNEPIEMGKKLVENDCPFHSPFSDTGAEGKSVGWSNTLTWPKDIFHRTILKITHTYFT